MARVVDEPAPSNDSWSRASMAFSVVARAVSSSPPGGTGRRRSGSSTETASASRRILSTGRSAAPTSSHPARERTASASGPPIARVAPSCRSWSRRSWSDTPTMSTYVRPPYGVGTASTRVMLSMPGFRRSKNPGRVTDRTVAGSSKGVALTIGLERRTRPEGSAICANASSVSISVADTTGMSGLRPHLRRQDLGAGPEPRVDLVEEACRPSGRRRRCQHQEHDRHPGNEGERDTEPDRIAHPSRAPRAGTRPLESSRSTTSERSVDLVAERIGRRRRPRSSRPRTRSPTRARSARPATAPLRDGARSTRGARTRSA